TVQINDSAPIGYTHLRSLAIKGGSGTNIFNVKSTAAGTPVTLTGGTGTSTFNVGSTAPDAGGTLTGIRSILTLNRAGSLATSATANVDDPGDTTGRSGTLSAMTVTGLGMSGSIQYAGLVHLNVNLGSGADSLLVTGLARQTTTTADGGPGSDTFTG